MVCLDLPKALERNLQALYHHIHSLVPVGISHTYHCEGVWPRGTQFSGCVFCLLSVTTCYSGGKGIVEHYSCEELEWFLSIALESKNWIVQKRM